MFGMQLSTWDEDQSGRCYDTGEPTFLGEYIYLSGTCIWAFGALLVCYRISISAQFNVSSLVHQVSPTSLLPANYTTSTTSTPSSPFTQPIAGKIFWFKLYRIIKASRDFLGSVPFYPPLAILFHKQPEVRVWAIILMAMIQYPLHLYMVISLRVRNEGLLGGDSENTWGFGQIVSLILCAAVMLECVKGVLGKSGMLTKAYLLTCRTS